MSEVFARRPVAPDVRGLRAPERTLELLRDLVHAHTGMYYDDSRLDFLSDRLAPLAIDRGFDSFLDYYYLLKYDPDAAGEWLRAIDALSVQETYFWREFDQIKALVETILPTLVERRRAPIRIASVPCASGEEPLSIAMALDDAGWFARAAIDIRAGDASPAALARAGGPLRRTRVPPDSRRHAREVLSTGGCAGRMGDPRGRPSPHLVVDAHQRRRAGGRAAAGAVRRHLLPQSFHLFHPGDGGAGRRDVRRGHAVAGISVRRRGRIAAANREPVRPARDGRRLRLREAMSATLVCL